MSAVVMSMWCSCTLCWDVVVLCMVSSGHSMMGQPAGSGLAGPHWIK